MTSLDAIKCKIGLHSWGEWEYETKFEKEIPDSCQAKRTCTACKAADSRDDEEHLWSEWEYLSETECTRKRICKRCGAVEKGAVLHRWREWGFAAGEPCQQKRSCPVCKASQTRQAHAWGEWKGKERACHRCKEKEYQKGKFNLCGHPDRCAVCNRNVGPGDGYSVPVSLFYKSERYREWLENGPMSFAINMAGGIDNFLIGEMCSEGRKHCTVCKECIDMFE